NSLPPRTLPDALPISMPAAPSRTAEASSHLPEVDGIRCIALVLVVAFHLFANGRVSGGVDVFLVVTGFLVTRSVYGRASSGADKDRKSPRLNSSHVII